jgi:hypothetical protein
MASRWELMDLSSLEYDLSRGTALADSGTGPPVSFSQSPAPAYGWAHMGTNAYDSSNFGLGTANCQAWTNSASGVGTVLHLAPFWAESAGGHTPWTLGSHPCGNPNRVWCVED